MNIQSPTSGTPTLATLALAFLMPVVTGSAFAGSAPAPAGKGVIPPPPATDWLDNTISPVTNPIFFEDPVIRNEVRPIFVYHRIDDGFITGGGDVYVYALQLRLALTDRLALIATKDGYIDIDLDNGGSADGWGDVALGFKYAVIDDRANQFIVTPGFTFEIPLGNREVFQGNGDGEWNLFVSAEKGFDDFHIQGNLGFRIPNNTSEESTILHYSLMADYHVCDMFIPFVTANAITVLDGGNALPLDTEGYDLINFGSSNSGGETQIALGVGFRSRLTKNLDFGFAYEKSVTSPEGLFDDRFTFDLSFRF